MSYEGPHEVVYKEVGDCRITVDWYAPTAPATTWQGSERPCIIFIHGGGFVLGHARMNSKLQIEDCLARGWIVVAPNHRLCPTVDVLEGPIADCQDLLVWLHSGALDALILAQLGEEKAVKVDRRRVVACGTSAGGNLAYSLAYASVRAPAPACIVDFYGAKNFSHAFWRTPLPNVPAPPLSDAQREEVYAEKPTATKGGPVSLEGQTPTGPPKPNARVALTLNTVKDGKVLEVIYPAGAADEARLVDIDPLLNVREDWPPVALVHGTEDVLIPIEHSRAMEVKLRKKGVKTIFIEVEGEGHTFAGSMVLGSRTWKTQRAAFDWAEDVLRSV